MTRDEAIINLKLSQNRIGGIKKEEWNALQMAIEALKADAVQGEWHKTENDEMEIIGYYCSVCDTPTDEPTHFCPNCGAKMKGGAE